MNPQGKEWGFPYLQNMKITLRAKDLIQQLITIWFTNFFPCLKQ